ncbi:hypothetical protein K6U48_09965 [Vibrio alginolyticus]|nr:hypothetical protein [Vibrio alginolyticus]
MALTMTYAKSVAGMAEPIIYPDAYWRILKLEGSKDELLVQIEVLETPESKGTVGLFPFTFTPDPEGVNYHQQAYDYLKALEPFQGAVDS